MGGLLRGPIHRALPGALHYMTGYDTVPRPPAWLGGPPGRNAATTVARPAMIANSTYTLRSASDSSDCRKLTSASGSMARASGARTLFGSRPAAVADAT